MNLKEMIATDIDSVFFKTDELADIVIIDGKECPIVLDQDYLDGKTEIYAAGLSEGEQLIFIREVDLYRLPQPGEQLTKDGKQWYIRHSINNCGVFCLRIGREMVYD